MIKNNKMRKIPNLMLSGPHSRKQKAKIISIIIVTLIISLGAFGYRTFDKPDLSNFGLNIKYAGYFVAMFLMFYISKLMGEAYWIDIHYKKMQFDERQIAVRKRVFEKSYKIIVGFIFAYLFFGVSLLNRVVYVNSKHDLNTVVVLTILYFFYSLPTMVAAWEKDS